MIDPAVLRMVPCRLQRALQGAEWSAERLKPVFQGGLIVVLEGRTLQTIPPAQLAEVCAWADWGATCGRAALPSTARSEG